MNLQDFNTLLTTGYMETNYPSMMQNLMNYIYVGGSDTVRWWQANNVKGYFDHDDFAWFCGMAQSINVIDQTGYDYLMTFQPAVNVPQNEPIVTSVP